MGNCLQREDFVSLRKINLTKITETFTKIKTRRVSIVENQ